MKLQLSEKKIELIQWLSSLEDSTIIENLLRFKNGLNKDWVNELSNEERNAVEKGINDADNKKLKSHDIAKERYEKWL